MLKKIGIYTRLYNEKNIIEWTKYHLKCGFDFILFYDDYSEPSVKSLLENENIDKSKYKVLEKIFPKFGSVTKDYLNDGESFEKYIKPEIENNMDYCLYIDLDEYLYLNEFKNINELIDYYNPFDQLFICYKNFGWDNKEKNYTNSLVNTFKKSQNYISSCGKSLVKVSKIINSTNPHYFHLKENSINKDQFNTFFSENWFSPTNEIERQKKNIYIAHYYTQDLETYINRRFFIKKDWIFCYAGWETFSHNLFKNTDNKEQVLNNISDYIKNYVYSLDNDEDKYSKEEPIKNITLLFWKWNNNAIYENTDLYLFYNQ